MFPQVVHYLDYSTVTGLQTECEGKVGGGVGDLYRLNAIALNSVNKLENLKSAMLPPTNTHKLELTLFVTTVNNMVLFMNPFFFLINNTFNWNSNLTKTCLTPKVMNWC